MKRLSIKEIFLILIIISLGIFISLNLFDNDKVVFIKDCDYLYDEAIKYIINNEDKSYENKEKYKLFVDYEKYGISKDSKYRYVYMWVYVESHYIENDKVVDGGGHSVPYKFVFSKNSKKVIDVIMPMDGREYGISIRKMFPKSVYKKILKHQDSNDKIENEVREYYEEIVDEK